MKNNLGNRLTSSILFGISVLLFDFFLIYTHITRIFGQDLALDLKQNLMLIGLQSILMSHLKLVFCLTLFSFLFLHFLEIKRKYYFFFALGTYIFMFALIHYPQLLQSTGINNFLPKNRNFLFSEGFAAVAAALGIIIFIRSLKLWLKARLIGRLGISLVSSISFMFIVLNTGSLYFYGTRAHNKIAELPAIADKKMKSIIVISIDALNIDSDSVIKTYANASLKKFLDSTELSTKTIADVTQTHGSLVSLFSGLRPYNTGVRYPFHPIAGNQNQNIFKTLKEMKEQGYKITFIRDEMVTASFYPGAIVDQVLLPSSEQKLNKFAYFYSSILTYGIFDNYFGRILFPEAYGNSSYYFGNQPASTAARVSKYFNETNNLEKPELLFFHSCALHAPLMLPYPYYPKIGQGEIDGIRFSYPTPFKQWKLGQRAQLLAEAPYNAEIYQSGVKYIVEQLLNPMFLELENRGFLKSATLFLISDHGENLWEGHNKVFGNLAIPFHGDTLLFGSKNEFAYFRVLNSKNATDDDHKEINLSQHFRQSLGLDYDKSITYTENSYVPLQESLSLIKTLNFMQIQRQLVVKRNPDYLTANDTLLNPAMMQKQKSVFADNYKLTSYETPAGRKLFLCEYEADPFCTLNYFGKPESKSIQSKLLEQLKSVNKIDSLANLEIPFNKKDPIYFNIKDIQHSLESPSLWIQFRAAEVLFFRFYDFEIANQLIKNIFEKTSDEDLKRLITKENQTRVFSTSLLENDGGFAKLAEKYDDITSLKERFNLPEAYEYLEKMRLKYGLKESQQISTLFKSLPPKDKIAEAKKFVEFIKSRFSYFFSYELGEEQVPYYFIKFYVFNAIELNIDHAILEEIKKSPTGIDFEITFFTYLAKKYYLNPLPTSTVLQDRRALILDILFKGIKS